MNIELTPINVNLPIDFISFVTMQPYIQFQLPAREPYKWSVDKVEPQIAAISRTLDLAENSYNGHSANFVLFPEYALPGIAAAQIIDNRINSATWTNNSIIIAGVHGLDKNEYRDICNNLNLISSPQNSPLVIPDDQWVNCCIIWVKENDGAVRKWVQPKIKPAWLEATTLFNDMFCGSTVYIYNALYVNGCPCNFFSLICYDWVAAQNESSVCDEVLGLLNTQWQGSLNSLEFAFVIQHNPKPNDNSFLDSTSRFFSTIKEYPVVDRKNAVVIHANTAAAEGPSKRGNGAFSACVFSPFTMLDCRAYRPTICLQPNGLRKSEILSRCKDVVFREMSECIHVFNLRIPRFVLPGPADRSLPIVNAKVYSTRDTNDPRLPGAAVPAAIKWINDTLDLLNSLCSNDLMGCTMKDDAEIIYSAIISQFRILDGPIIDKYISWATCSYSHSKLCRDDERQKNVDSWDVSECNALEHVVNSLTLLRLAFDIELNCSSSHGVLNKDNVYIQIIAIKGESFEDCRHHYESSVPKGIDPVLVIARDKNNLTPLPEEYQKYYETGNNNGLLDYQSLINECREVGSTEDLRGWLNEHIQLERRII